MGRLAGFMKAIAALFTSAQIASADVPELSVEEVFAAAQAGEVILVDIRTPGEWNQTGMPAPAHGIDLHSPTFVEDLRALMAQNAGVPIAMICAAGNRSSFATSELEKHGFKDLINVPEGMMGSGNGPGWIKRGLPIRPAQTPKN